MLPFQFYLITGNRNGRHDPMEWTPRLAQAGLRAMQVREKDFSPRTLYQYCAALTAALPDPPHPLQLYLNDRADLALSLGWRGVHLREESLSLADHAPVLRSALDFGVSCHNLAGVLAAEAAGASFATLGPIYATPSKAAYGDPLGIDALGEAVVASPLPLIALGGVTPERVRECIAAGAAGVAAISAIWEADHPVKALHRFREALGGL